MLLALSMTHLLDVELQLHAREVPANVPAHVPSHIRDLTPH